MTVGFPQVTQKNKTNCLAPGIFSRMRMRRRDFHRKAASTKVKSCFAESVMDSEGRRRRQAPV